ncbi:hypothetical protein [Shinella pollutisoli]|uniref:Uncharacterized protein n=1 Tax=Shinella pollutisoli TaxID=2250594 RepID=A0ABV7D9C1_9HYPH|nr:hypothetical protein [Shinella pollutisoli]
MTSKFAALAANVSDTFRVELIDPITDDVLRDKAGNAAYIDVLSVDSEAGRKFDADARQRAFRSARKSRTGHPDIDPDEENRRKLAQLTRGWRLVDPVSREGLDVPCTPENALELYCEAGMAWLFDQVFAGAANAGNFMRRRSTTSSPSPRPSFETPTS